MDQYQYIPPIPPIPGMPPYGAAGDGVSSF